MDIATILGLTVGFGGIFIAHMIEGGQVGSLIQITAGIIVLAGTLGAVLVSHPFGRVKKAILLSVKAVLPREEEQSRELEESFNKINEFIRIYKKDSLLALESKLSSVQDIFLRRIIKSLIDGVDTQNTKEIYESEIEAEEVKLLQVVKVWTDAGGFAPTIGILGAVLGLIHVMGNLTDTSKLGSGIAVAFVATVYGVGFANLLFIPLGNKLKSYVRDYVQRKRIILEGALMIVSGLSTQIAEQKMKSTLEIHA